MVIIDTSIIIDHLRSSDIKETVLMKLAKLYKTNELAISLITIQELYEGKSSINDEKEAFLLATISPLLIFEYDYKIAKRAGEIARDLSDSIEFADASIAATALENNCKIATLNLKDFKKIKNLEIIEI